jgi:hypothetical protein
MPGFITGEFLKHFFPQGILTDLPGMLKKFSSVYLQLDGFFDNMNDLIINFFHVFDLESEI